MSPRQKEVVDELLQQSILKDASLQDEYWVTANVDGVKTIATFHALDEEDCKRQFEELLKRRGHKHWHALRAKKIPKFASMAESRRWWHTHGGNVEIC